MNYSEELIESKDISLGCKLTIKKKQVGKDRFYHLSIIDPKVNKVETILSTGDLKVAKDKFDFVYEQTK
jgi:hypothetical protein